MLVWSWLVGRDRADDKNEAVARGDAGRKAGGRESGGAVFRFEKFEGGGSGIGERVERVASGVIAGGSVVDGNVGVAIIFQSGLGGGSNARLAGGVEN